MKAVFGLGNPGPNYVLTRHNAGFQVVDLYRQIHLPKRKGRVACSALVYRWENLLLVKPLTSMNESGVAVRCVMEKHGLDPRDVLIIYDDLDLPLGRIKVLAAGGAGSHNGMRSVLSTLGTEQIPRLRIGIEIEERSATGREYVLDRYTPREWEWVVPALERAAEAVDLFRDATIDAVMTRFNSAE